MLSFMAEGCVSPGRSIVLILVLATLVYRNGLLNHSGRCLGDSDAALRAAQRSRESGTNERNTLVCKNLAQGHQSRGVPGGGVMRLGNVVPMPSSV